MVWGRYIENLARNLKKPSEGYFGVYIRYMLSANKPLERNAVRLLQIEPHDNILEVGFGPGHGFKYVFDTGYLNGSGKMYGVDFSPAMCDHAKKRFATAISSGKLEILNEDVGKMSLPDSYFDKVFHTNSHLYWPDLNAACSELYRVMKPGSVMVTIMHLERIKKVTGKMGILRYAPNTDPEKYMDAAKKSGFVGIEIKEVKGSSGSTMHAITCEKN